MASGHWGMQKWAIEHLANRQDPAIVPALLQAAKDKQREVRLAAFDQLGDRRIAEALPLLAAALETKEDRMAAAKNLGKLASPAAFDTLIEALPRQHDPYVIRTFAEALGGTVRDAGSLPRLLAAMEPIKKQLIDCGPCAAAFDYATALAALAKAAAGVHFGSGDSVAPLLVGTMERIRNPVALSVLTGAVFELPPGLALLTPFLQSYDQVVVMAVAESIFAKSGEAQAAVLAAFRTNQNPEGVARGLANIAVSRKPGWEAAVGVINEALTSNNLVAGKGSYRYFVVARRVDAIEYLEAVLEKHGGKEMAEVFLHSGNDRLARAAGAWAQSHGYRIEIQTVPRSQGPAPWGNP
jgi:HEAT repeats